MDRGTLEPSMLTLRQAFIEEAREPRRRTSGIVIGQAAVYRVGDGRR